jgi:hypothetical protein
MLKKIKFNSRLIIFALLTLFSLLLLGAAGINSNAKEISNDENRLLINNLLECNKQLYDKSDASWRKILHKDPLLMLRLEASELPR